MAQNWWEASRLVDEDEKWWESSALADQEEAPKPAEPGLIERAGDALSTIGSAVADVTGLSAAKDFFFPEEQKSVMEGYGTKPDPAVSIRQRGAPVKAEYAEGVRRALEVRSPEERDALQAKAAGTVLERVIPAQRANIEQHNASPEPIRRALGDVEARAAGIREAGAGDETARNMAISDILFGTPTAKPDVLSPVVDQAASDRFAQRLADVGDSARQIPAVVLKGIGDLSQLATLGALGDGLSERMSESIAQIEGGKSTEARIMAEKFQRAMESEAVSPGAAVRFLLENPGFAAELALPSLGAMVMPVGAAKVAERAAAALKWVSSLDEAARLKTLEQIREAAVLSTVSAQNAAETFTSTKGDLGDKYIAATIAALGSLAAGKATGGGLEGILARGTRSGLAGGARGAGAGVIREGSQESGEAFSQAIGQQVGETGTINPRAALKQAAVEGTLGAAIGGPLGAVSGAIDRTPRADSPMDVPPAVQNFGVAPPRSGYSAGQYTEARPATVIQSPETEAAGLTPLVVPQGVAQAGAAPQVDPLPQATDSELIAALPAEARGAFADQAQPETAAPTSPQKVEVDQWTGRRGAGYLTEADALQALPGRQRQTPEWEWRVEQGSNGRYRLVAYAAQPSPAGQMAAGATNATGVRGQPTQTTETPQRRSPLNLVDSVRREREFSAALDQRAEQPTILSEAQAIAARQAESRIPDTALSREMRRAGVRPSANVDTAALFSPTITSTDVQRTSETGAPLGPFTNRESAQIAIQRGSLQATHVAVPVEGGYVARPVTTTDRPAPQAETQPTAPKQSTIQVEQVAQQSGSVAQVFGQTDRQGVAGNAAPVAGQPGVPPAQAQAASPTADTAVPRLDPAQSVGIVRELNQRPDVKSVGGAQVINTPKGESARMARAVSAVFGRPVMFVRAKRKGKQMPFEAAYHDSGAILFDEKTTEPHLALAWHEIGHGLDDDIRNDLIAALRPQIRNRKTFVSDRPVYRNLSRDRIDEEIVMHLAQGATKDTRFWDELASKLGDNEFGRMAKQILSVLDRLIAGFNRENYAAFAKDLAAVRSAVADAYAKQLTRTGNPEAARRIASGETEAEGKTSFAARRSKEEIRSGADQIAAMDEDARDNTDSAKLPGGYASYKLYEARKLVPKPSNKLKRVTSRNNYSLEGEFEFIANVDGEHYGITKQEDPDDVDNEDAFVYAYEPLGEDGDMTVTTTSDLDELFAEIRAGGRGGQLSMAARKAKPEPRKALEQADLPYTLGIDPQPSKIRLSPAEYALSALPITYGGEGATATKQSVRQAAQSLQDRAEAALQEMGLTPGDIYSPEMVEVASKIIAAEIEVALRKPGNAQDWYSGKLRGTMAVAALIHPELKTDVKSRAAFLMALAITSQNMAVSPNLQLAEEQYAAWKTSGRFPENRGMGTAASQMKRNFAKANALLAEYSPERLIKFLNSEFTVGELARAGWTVAGEKADTVVYGSAIFGPKIGNGFYQNISGNFSPLTMDMWFMRGIGRVVGDLISGSPQEFARLKTKFLSNTNDFDITDLQPSSDFTEETGVDAFTEENIKEDDVAVELAKRVDAWFSKEFRDKRAKYDSGELTKPQFVNDAQRLLEQGSTKDIPQNGTHRNQLRLIFAGALELLAERGIRLTNADAQAIWWFPEKDLYATLGAGGKKSAPTDYEREIIEVARKRGISDEKIQDAVAGSRRDDGVSGGAEADGQGAQATGGPREQFTGRERKEFLRQRVLSAYRGSSGSYGKSSGGAKGARVSVGSVKFNAEAKYSLPQAQKNALNAVGIGTPNFFEIKSAAAFRAAIEGSKANNPFASSVYVYPEAEYEQMRLFVADGGKVGFALKGDEIVSVFNYDPEQKGAANAALLLAVQEGGRRLDAFDTALPHIYALNGFEPTGRVRWNDEYAPEGWDKDAYREYSNGEPDVVLMAYNPNSFRLYQPGEGQYFDDYDQAVQGQRAAAANPVEPDGFKYAARAAGPAEPAGGPGPRSDAGERVAGQGWSKRPARPGSAAVDGWHYGRERVPMLSGSAYGRGIKGAEAARLAEATDPRIKRRVYFYIQRPDGSTPAKEQGLGPHRYEQRLNNLYDPGASPPISASSTNAFESAVLDAGYDGYLNRALGMAVVLDADVPATYVGTDFAGPPVQREPAPQARLKKALMGREIPIAEQIARDVPGVRVRNGSIEIEPGMKDQVNEALAAADIGIRFAARRQTETPEFRAWFGDSKIRNSDGTPKVMYHGTARDITEFRPKQANAIFVTDDPRFAEGFADMSAEYVGNEANKRLSPQDRVKVQRAAIKALKANGYSNTQIKALIEDGTIRQTDEWNDVVGPFVDSAANIMPLFVKSENPFDYEDWSQTTALMGQLAKNGQILGPRDQDALVNGNWGLIESAEVQQALKQLGHDGFYVSEGGRKNLAVYDSRQIKSATGNQGTFDGTNPDIRFAARAGRFSIPNETAAQLWRRKMQDSMLRVRQVQETILGQGGRVSEKSDVYEKETLSHGRKQARVDEFRLGALKPLIERAAKAGISLDELALYAYAKHAPERNARMQAINPNVTTGSGMDDTTAQMVIDEVVASGKQADYDALHQDLLAITKGTRRLLVDSGLITMDQYVAMENQFSDYVPLRGFGEAVGSDIRPIEDDTEPTRRVPGRRIDVRGNVVMRALGRDSLAAEIIENIVSDRIQAISRAEDNLVARSFLKLVQDNPDPTLWEINAPTRRRAIDPDTGLVRESMEVDAGEDTIGVRIQGRQVYVKVKDPLLLRAMKGGDRQSKSYVIAQLMHQSGLDVYTTWLRNTLTQWNPTFLAVNTVRDVQSGAAGVLQHLGYEGVAAYAKAYPEATAAAFRAATNRQGNSQWDSIYREYARAGGITGGYFAKGMDEIKSEMDTMIAMAGGSVRSKRARFAAAKGVRFGTAFFRGVEAMGMMSENAARVAAYKVARDMGKSPQEAASIAKNLTTNFNRKGEWGPALNSLYLFYNASVQGATRTLQALSSPKVRYTMAAITAMTAGLALQNADIGGEDEDGERYWDKIPDYEKERNLILMLPPGVEVAGSETIGSKGRYVKFPLPYGFNVFTVLGYNLTDTGRHIASNGQYGISPAKGALRIVSAIMGSFNPIGGAIDLTKPTEVGLALSPTLGDIGIQLGFEVNSFGRPVAPLKMPHDDRPDSQRYSARQAGGVAQRLTDWAYRETAGRDYLPTIDVAPGTVENLAGIAGGGAGRFIYDAFVNIPTKWAADEPFSPRDVPFWRTFEGEVTGDIDVGNAWERAIGIKEEAASVKRKLEMGINVDFDNPERGALLSMEKFAKNYTKAMSKLKKAEIELMTSDAPDAEKRAERKRIEAARKAVAQAFNTGYVTQMRASREPQ